MGLTKKELYTESQNTLASMAKLLAHPARIAILQRLIDRKDCVCGDLVEEIGLAQATISQHLKELKKMDLITGTISGVSVCYCINPETFKNLRKTFDNFLGQQVSSNC